MIRQSLRTVPAWPGVLSLSIAVILGAAGASSAGSTLEMGALLTLVMASLLLPAEPTFQDLVLPLPPRTVFWWRFVPRALLMSGPFVLVGIGELIYGTVGGSPVRFNDPWFSTTLFMAWMALLAAVMPFLFARSPLEQSQVAATRARVALMLLVTISLPIVSLGAARSPWRVLVAATLAAGLVLWCRRVWPAALSVRASVDDGTPNAARAHVALTGGMHHLPLVPRLMLQQMPNKSLLISSGMFMAVFAGSGYMDVSPVIALQSSFLLSLPWIQGSRTLSLLPVHPRRRLLWATLLGPGLALGCWIGGTVAGQLLRTPQSHRYAAPFYDELGGGWNDPSRVNLAFWRWTRDSVPPSVVAPWGEGVTPYAARLYGFTLYNPYTVSKSSTGEFVAWQWDRLSRAAYGAPVSRRDLDTPAQPRMVTHRLPVLSLHFGAVATILLLQALGAWWLRGGTGLPRSVAAYVLGFSPVAFMLVGMLGREGFAFSLWPALVDQAALALLAFAFSTLHAGEIMATLSVMLVAVLPVMLACVILWREASVPVLELVTATSSRRWADRG